MTTAQREAVERLMTHYGVLRNEYINEDHDDPDLKQTIDDWYVFAAEYADVIAERDRLAKQVERLRMALADCRTPMPCSPWLTDIRLGVINQVVDAVLQEKPDA